MKIQKGKEILFKLSKRSPIQKGIIINDIGLNRIWVKPVTNKKEANNVIAVSRNFIYY